MSLPVEDRAEGGAFDEAIRTQVAFAGTMRSNLCKMLDEAGLPDAFGVDGTADLFSLTCPDVATTSALTYPTFTGEKNFAGIRGAQRVSIFDDMLKSLLLPRLAAAPNAFIVPLGKAVESFLTTLSVAKRGSASEAPLDFRRILRGLPHPSGGNGHRCRQFAENRMSLEQQIRDFFRH